LSVILEQKKAIVNYTSDHDLPAILTKNHWTLLEKLVELLSPFKKFTRHVSSSDASLADVIPVVTALPVTMDLTTPAFRQNEGGDVGRRKAIINISY